MSAVVAEEDVSSPQELIAFFGVDIEAPEKSSSENLITIYLHSC